MLARKKYHCWVESNKIALQDSENDKQLIVDLTRKTSGKFLLDIKIFVESFACA